MLKEIKVTLATVLLSLSSAALATPVELPALNALPDKTSISGLSSGAFMASQFHVAYSEELIGAGIVAGGPWNCAGNNPFGNPFLTPIVSATTTCMNPCQGSIIGCPSMMFPDSGYLVDLAKNTAKSGDIDELENLKNDKVYIFSGSSDETVVTGVVNTTTEFYQKLGLSDDNILYSNQVDAGHAFITTDPKDTECSITEAPYINDCDIPQAQQILEHIYGKQKPASKKLTGELIEFDQTAFFDKPLTSMNDTAFVYVPDNCRTEQCKVHVSMHGCEQGVSVIGTTYIEETGYMEAADTNSTIVLYPQVKKSTLNPMNPKGCWDFWGYSSNNLPPYKYFSKEAPQMVAIKKMIDHLISKPMKLTKN
ncbi:poly(3-hydroxybutyrate) depolymerase [Vibrio sp. Of7-15]|uniref:extracellular catalytic domain type 2 short-chain-length polyhydroxyalkanoate depolymerase n=1 Tax=Vibrio sp. Of7-15 TaxID=2724879 RepID=UPI001EF31184|nr:poly(3-hydroxybutyrate) depolymerase [Vibrio sp. Of7-15]MCG7499230.1 poly(3-hydroxybutyrate) depolymerase [Vibrio sp. Of7-15]